MNPIVLFDGVCKFCDGSMNFIIAHDKAMHFKFAPLQSEAGKALVEKFGLVDIDSVILVEGETAYKHSTAALRIAKHLDGIWSIAYWLIVIPRPIRDFFYKLFARNRYRLFGRYDVCMMPTPEIKSRFL